MHTKSAQNCLKNRSIHQNRLETSSEPDQKKNLPPNRLKIGSKSAQNRLKIGSTALQEFYVKELETRSPAFSTPPLPAPALSPVSMSNGSYVNSCSIDEAGCQPGGKLVLLHWTTRARCHQLARGCSLCTPPHLQQSCRPPPSASRNGQRG